MKVVCLIGSLRPGGAERVFVQVVSWLAAHGASVHVVTTARAAPHDLLLPESVVHSVVHPPSSKCDVRGLVSLPFRLRSALLRSSPDVLLSFLTETNVAAVAVTAGSRVPVVVSERVDFRQHRMPAHWEWLRRWCYPRAAAVVVQTDELAQWIARRRPSWRAVVIPNPVLPPPPEPRQLPSAVPAGPLVLAVGRLVPQKGFDVLIEAFGRLADRHPAWSLVLVGDGPDAGALQAAVDRRSLSQRIVLLGRVDPPWALYRRAEVFAMASRYEGFPNSLAEAMAHGMAVVATDCPTGPRELVQDQVNGRLVPVDDAGALEQALDRLLTSREERARLGAEAQRVVHLFSPDEVLPRWGAALGACSRTSLPGIITPD